MAATLRAASGQTELVACPHCHAFHELSAELDTPSRSGYCDACWPAEVRRRNAEILNGKRSPPEHIDVPPGFDGETIVCGCGSRARHVDASVVHDVEIGERSVYLCLNPACGAYVAAHDGTNIPMGTPADRTTRRLRGNVHRHLDALWKDRAFGLGRAAVYRLAAEFFGTEPFHVGWMGEAQCTIYLARADLFTEYVRGRG